MGRKLISRRTFLLGSIGSVAYLLYEKFSIRVTKYTISLPGLPSEFAGLTILHLSDLHSKWYGENQTNLLETINKHHFDLVAITGDIVKKQEPQMEPALTLIRGLKNKPVFFVPGNHEWWSGYKIRKPLQDLGVHILENTAWKFAKDASHIWILGVDDPYLRRDKLESAESSVEDSALKILLAHAPNIYPSAVKSKIPLVLVGHTHGGQVRIPFIGAVVVPGQGLFPKFDYGLYTDERTTMIINGGLGESTLPVRFNIRPEIVLVELTSS